MRTRGLTLIELLVVLGISLLLLRMAMVDMPQMVARWRAIAAINAIVGAVQSTRHSAVVHRTPAVMCPAVAPGVDRCGRRNSWHNGALVFTDTNGNRRPDASDVVTARLPAMRRGERVYWRAFRNRAYLRFAANGLTDWQNGHFQYCPPDGDTRFSRVVVINSAGRARHARDTDGDGIVESVSGRALRC